MRIAGADLMPAVAGHRRGRGHDRRLDLIRSERRIRFQQQRAGAGHVRRGHRRAVHAGVPDGLGDGQARALSGLAERRGVGFRRDDGHARRGDGRVVDRIARNAARREAGQTSLLVGRGHADHPRRVGVRIHGVVAGAFVAGGENDRDAAIVQHLRGDADGIFRIERAARPPAVADDADVVDVLMREDVVESFQRPEDGDRFAGADADEVRARRHAGELAAALACRVRRWSRRRACRGRRCVSVSGRFSR